MSEWISRQTSAETTDPNNSSSNSNSMPRPPGRRSIPTPTTSKQNELAAFVSRYHLPTPEYKVMSDGTSAPARGRGRPKPAEYFGAVKLGEKSYISAPQTLPSEEAAREFVAGEALKALQETEAQLEQAVGEVPDSHQANFLVEQIIDIVKDAPSGQLASYVSEEYLRRHKALLPIDWLDIVRSTDSRLEVEEAHYNRDVTIIRLKPLPIVVYQDNWINASDFFEVVVTRVISPVEFWIQNREVADPEHAEYYAKEPHSEEFKKLFIDMNEYYKKVGNFFKVTNDDIVKDKIVAGKITKPDGSVSWHRIQINDCNESDQISGILVDHGSCQQFSLKDIQMLPVSLCSLPKQAHKAALHGIQPIGDDWSDQEVQTFREMILNKSFVAKLHSAKEGVLLVTLVDTSQSDDDIDITSLVIDRQVGRASADPAA